MNRRTFSQLTTLSGFGLSTNSLWPQIRNTDETYQYNLNYAPHLGMFRNHVGNNPIDQLNFMADKGFRAFEDNDMRKREVGLQKKRLMQLGPNGSQMKMLLLGVSNHRQYFSAMVRTEMGMNLLFHMIHMLLVNLLKMALLQRHLVHAR